MLRLLKQGCYERRVDFSKKPTSSSDKLISKKPSSESGHVASPKYVTDEENSPLPGKRPRDQQKKRVPEEKL